MGRIAPHPTLQLRSQHKNLRSIPPTRTSKPRAQIPFELIWVTVLLTASLMVEHDKGTSRPILIRLKHFDRLMKTAWIPACVDQQLVAKWSDAEALLAVAKQPVDSLPVILARKQRDKI